MQAPQDKGFYVLNDILRVSPSDSAAGYIATPIAAPVIIPHANGHTAAPAAYLVGGRSWANQGRAGLSVDIPASLEIAMQICLGRNPSQTHTHTGTIALPLCLT